MKSEKQSGMALIGTLLILVLLGALLEGFIISINSDQGLIGTDREQNRAFYGALAGLEQLTASVGTLFDSNYAPTVAQINALTVTPPTVAGLAFVSPDGSSGYRISMPPLDAQGRPRSDTRTIPSGPYEGLVGLITPYTMTVTARTPTRAEVRMQRSLQTVAVPVFQFGIFSETDLSFFAGPNFDFGGRIHTNGNLFLAEGDGNTLTLRDRVTAVGEIVRTNLNNNWITTNSYNGTVRVVTTPGAFRNLARTEGSLVGTLGSANNDPTWTNLSIGSYNGNIRNGRTGARRMDLPLVSLGATPIDIIRRPELNENVDVLNQRYFALASLRILLSDNAADITSLPTVTGTAAVRLTGTAPNGTLFAIAPNPTGDPDFKVANATPLIDGFIKIEMQDASRNWSDVTNEILGLGIAGRDLTSTGSLCTNQPNAIIRVQRLKDNPTTPACGGAATQYWPNTLYDTREGVLRDNIPENRYELYLGGVMHYIELDISNLCRWFRGEVGFSGANAINETGYVVYFSDRRTNRNGANAGTGEYGFEDNVNLADVTNGIPNNLLDTGEDVNGNGALDTNGETPILATGAAAPLDVNARPWNYAGVTASIARKNRPIFFRRALKLANGSVINLGMNGGVPFGLAVTSENPVYVQGDYNFSGSYDGAHVAASVIADSVTLLSNAWNDGNSFNCPHTLAATCNGTKPGRAAATTSYRMAVIAGKGRPFPHPDSLYQDFGTDGGVHNFLRYLENWGGQQLNYRGSIVSLYFNRQATGIYKCCTNVYSPPTRGYNFDVEFLQPSYLPPRTPMFRDVNITGFTRMAMPNQ
jgi:hypothetical protein